MATGFQCKAWKGVEFAVKDSNGIKLKSLSRPQLQSSTRSIPTPIRLSSDVLSLHSWYSQDPAPSANRISCHSGRNPFGGALLQREVVKDKDIFSTLNEVADDLENELNGLNIFLIGMMGCGKSTVGRILSDSLGYTFFDSDTMVEKSVGATVASIFHGQGERAFRDLESQAISQLSTMESLVISTGGGAIVRDDNWSSMKNGITVWIDVPLEDLARRVVSAGIGSRPILSEGLVNEHDAYNLALNRLHSVFQTRAEMYLRADVRVSLDDVATNIGLGSVKDLSPELITLQLMMAVKQFLIAREAEAERKELVDSGCMTCMIPPYGFEGASENALKEIVSSP